MTPKNILRSVIHPVYQPIVDHRDGQVVYFEALMRTYNDHTETLHMDLLRIGETTGMIRFIDHEILSQVLDEIERARVVIGANISVASIEMAGEELLSLIESRSAAAGNLVLEITETLPISRRDIVFEFVSQVRALGCSIALDDFGAGNFTDEDIKDLRPDYVKLDGSLVNALLLRGNTAALEEMTVNAVELGFGVIAEKIDSSRKQDFMSRCGVHFLQGYYLGRPTLAIQSASSPAFNGNYAKLSGIPSIPSPSRITARTLHSLYVSGSEPAARELADPFTG